MYIVRKSQNELTSSGNLFSIGPVDALRMSFNERPDAVLSIGLSLVGEYAFIYMYCWLQEYHYHYQ